MTETFSITTPSPDNNHVARLLLGGEIRFGPFYYSLEVDEYRFGQRVFGDVSVWSSTSHFVAVQEWLTIDYTEGPITTLVLIDVVLRRETTIAKAIKGFVVPAAFDQNVLHYHTNYAGRIEHATCDFTQLNDWSDLV